MTLHRHLASALAGLLALGCASASVADEASATRRVTFRVQSAREVANDRLRATLSVNDEDADPAKLADRVNRAMAKALEAARREKAVKVESGGYHTSPVYDKGRVRRWRASQQLLLTSADFEAATKLIGTLQATLQLQGLSFDVSPEAQKKVEDALIEEALAAFRARADLVRENLGAKGYEIVRVNVQTPGTPPPPRPMAMRAMAAAEMAPAPPAVEGGTTRVVVSIDAEIELD